MMKGTSSEIRKITLWRNYWYLMIYFYISCIHLATIIEPNNPWGENHSMEYGTSWYDLMTWFNLFYYVFYYLCGVMLALVRFREPYVFNTFCNELSKLPCLKKRNKIVQ